MSRGGGKSTSVVTITCEAQDTRVLYMSPDGVWHDATQQLQAGENIIEIMQYSPLGVYNTYGYSMTNLKNLQYAGNDILTTQAPFKIYYATDSIASGHQPTD